MQGLDLNCGNLDFNFCVCFAETSHSTSQTIANSPQTLAAGDFDRPMLLPAMFHEPAQVWAIDPSLLLVHVCGKIYHFIFVTLNCHFSSFAGY